MPKIGINTIGTMSRTKAVSLGDVYNISTRPPRNKSTLRSATETDDPITDKISVVSVVIRDKTSPVRMFS